MSEGGCGSVSVVEERATELFQLAALLMGDSMQAVSLVEQTLSELEMDPCLEPEAARAATTRALVANAQARLEESEPASFHAAPEAAAGQALCLDLGDVNANGGQPESAPEPVRAWLAGEARGDLRSWLSALSGRDRLIFVEHAVLGLSHVAIAASMPAAAPAWTPDAVGEVYRQALCSLANSMVHSPAAPAEQLAIPAMSGV